MATSERLKSRIATIERNRKRAAERLIVVVQREKDGKRVSAPIYICLNRDCQDEDCTMERFHPHDTSGGYDALQEAVRDMIETVAD